QKHLPRNQEQGEQRQEHAVQPVGISVHGKQSTRAGRKSKVQSPKSKKDDGRRTTDDTNRRPSSIVHRPFLTLDFGLWTWMIYRLQQQQHIEGYPLERGEGHL